MTELASLIAELHDSEINCGLQTFCFCGARAWLGDELNGEKAAASFGPDRLHLIAAWLESAAIEHYPESEFALRRRDASRRVVAQPEHAAVQPPNEAEVRRGVGFFQRFMSTPAAFESPDPRE